MERSNASFDCYFISTSPSPTVVTSRHSFLSSPVTSTTAARRRRRWRWRWRRRFLQNPSPTPRRPSPIPSRPSSRFVNPQNCPFGRRILPSAGAGGFTRRRLRLILSSGRSFLTSRLVRNCIPLLLFFIASFYLCVCFG